MTDFLRDHPRMRGEYVFDLFEFSAIMGSPPHARGILYAEDVEEVAPRITPACAGNTTVAYLSSSSKRDHPRMRGEYALDGTPMRGKPGSPPHARGILFHFPTDCGSYGITPACAGNTFQRVFCFLVSRDHPRMRGEYLSEIRCRSP